MPCGSRIELTVTRHDNVVAVGWVRWSGIPEAERENVFRRLYRLGKSRTTPGNGLGLSLVKAIADLHGATIVLGDRAPPACRSPFRSPPQSQDRTA